MKGANGNFLLAGILLIAAFFSFFANAGAQQNEALSKPDTLEAVSQAIDSYKGKAAVMRLRLKNVDPIFYTITFYDGSNHDVVFDISSKKEWKAFQPMLLNAHAGMFYDVVFKINGSGNLGLLDCSLVSFKPVILDILPENTKAE